MHLMAWQSARDLDSALFYARAATSKLQLRHFDFRISQQSRRIVQMLSV